MMPVKTGLVLPESPPHVMTAARALQMPAIRYWDVSIQISQAPVMRMEMLVPWVISVRMAPAL